MLRSQLRWLPFLFGMSVVSVSAQQLWWSARGVLTNQAADDYTVANIGQLKTVASAAALEMNLRLPGGAGASVNSLVYPWWQPAPAGVSRDDFAALNVGQLKTAASVFYTRLGLVLPTTGVADDYALANLGQLKNVFNFVITVAGDTDGDGLLDSWEIANFGVTTAQTGMADADGDGLSNLAESRTETNPAPGGAAAAAALGLTVFSP